MADDTGKAQSDIWPVPKFHFQLKWNGHEAQFQEVSGLDVETQMLEFPAGNIPGHSTHKMPEMPKWPYVTAKYVKSQRDNALYDWFNETRTNTIARHTMTIVLLDQSGTPTMEWTLLNAFPIKIVTGDLNAKTNEVSIESVEFSHEGIEI